MHLGLRSRSSLQTVACQNPQPHVHDSWECCQCLELLQSGRLHGVAHSLFAHHTHTSLCGRFWGHPRQRTLATSSFQQVQNSRTALGLRFKASKAQPPKQAQVLQEIKLQRFQDKAVVAPIPTRVDRLDSQLKQVLLDEQQLKPRDAAAPIAVCGAVSLRPSRSGSAAASAPWGVGRPSSATARLAAQYCHQGSNQLATPTPATGWPEDFAVPGA